MAGGSSGRMGVFRCQTACVAGLDVKTALDVAKSSVVSQTFDRHDHARARCGKHLWR